MELLANERQAGKKSELGRIRRAGDIPAVVYNGGKENAFVSIDGAQFQSHLRAIPKGNLATTKFEIKSGKESFQALVKDITYHRTTYNIEHIDLMRVTDDMTVTLHVPVKAKGREKCPGITQGGQLRMVKRSVKITMKVSEIPEAFIVDVSSLNLGGTIRVKDLPLTGSMVARIDGNQVLVVVNK